MLDFIKFWLSFTWSNELIPSIPKFSSSSLSPLSSDPEADVPPDNLAHFDTRRPFLQGIFSDTRTLVLYNNEKHGLPTNCIRITTAINNIKNELRHNLYGRYYLDLRLFWTAWQYLHAMKWQKRMFQHALRRGYKSSESITPIITVVSRTAIRNLEHHPKS